MISVWGASMNAYLLQNMGDKLAFEIHSFRVDGTYPSKHDPLCNSDTRSVFDNSSTVEARLSYPAFLQVVVWENTLESTGMRSWNNNTTKSNHWRFCLGCSGQGGDTAVAAIVLRHKV